jgi:outer membrane receptor protein involved in Fe transport
MYRFSGGRTHRANWLVVLAVASAISGGSAAAVAQDQSGGEEELQSVVVTGSRIIREGMSSPTPVTSLSAEELLQSNPHSVAEALALLPSMGTSTTPKSIGGRSTLGPGSFLNLRNLGSTRNLVLLDGRRVVPSNIAGNTDINLLPQSLISNVSVVTGGASAAYGSDAVAGVTNFILDTKFTGFKFDVNGGESAHNEDGGSYKTSIAWGTGLFGDRAHLIASFDWRHSSSAYQQNRTWANQNCALIPIPGVTAATQSPTNPRQTIACGVTQANASYGGAIIAGPLVTPTQGISFDSNGNPVPFVYGQNKTTNLQVGGSGNLMGDVVNFITPMDNKVGFAHLSFDVTDNLEAFVQGTVSRAASLYAQTPPYFYGSTPLNIQSGNPFIPTSIQDRMTALNVPGFALNTTPKSWGVIGTDTSYETWEALAGVKGKFGDTWNWDAHYEHGRTAFKVIYRDQINVANLYRAVDAVRAPDGSIACYSALIDPARYGDCVPLNPMGANSASPEALAYIHGEPWNYNIMEQDNASASISGEPFSSWAGPVSVGAGVEWRQLQGLTSSDPVSHSTMDFTGVRNVPPSLLTKVGGWATTNLLETSGSYTVKEGFIETLVPLAKDQAWAKSLDLNAAGRVTDYSQSGTVETWKVGLTYRPLDELLLRATRSRDIRAPGIGDLYSKDSLSPNVILTDRLNNNASVSVPTALAGNPNLKPEKADTTTVGFTYQPGWLSGFGLSVDYYNIEIKDVLAAVGAQETIDRCALGQQQFCDLLIRSNGTLTLVRLPTQNLSEAKTRGIDLDASYRTNVFDGTAVFRLIGTRLLEQSTTTPTITVAGASSSYRDRVGDMGLGYAKWLVSGTATYDRGPIGVNAVARFVSDVKFNTTYVAGDLDPRFTDVPSMLTVDLGAHYRFESVAGGPELYFNVANVLDRDPPLIPGASLIGFQTNSTLYDTMGRYYTLGMRVQF